MAKILAIDYGTARCGLAETDSLGMIASGLPTVETRQLFPFLDKYVAEEKVETVVIGLPVDLRGNLSAVEQNIQQFTAKFREKFPDIKVERFDERFTSKMASYFISQSGKTKKKREEKGLVDKVSATLLLQNFLEYRNR